MSANQEMRVYIAAPFFTEEQLKVVKNIESLLYDSSIKYFSPRLEGVLQKMSDDERKLKMKSMFDSNVAHMDWATHVIAVIDDYDTGTVWEMGYCYAMKKSIVTFSANYHGINVMLNESIKAHTVHLLDIVPALYGQFSGDKTSKVT